MPTLINQTEPPGRQVLEWSMAGVSLVGGAAIALVGAGCAVVQCHRRRSRVLPRPSPGSSSPHRVRCRLLQLALARRSNPGSQAEPGAVGDPVIDDGDDDAAFPDRAGWLRVGIIVGAVLVAALALPVIGYTLTMTAMLAVVLFFVSRRPWWLALVLGVAAAVASPPGVRGLAGHRAADLHHRVHRTSGAAGTWVSTHCSAGSPTSSPRSTSCSHSWAVCWE